MASKNSAGKTRRVGFKKPQPRRATRMQAKPMAQTGPNILVRAPPTGMGISYAQPHNILGDGPVRFMEGLVRGRIIDESVHRYPGFSYNNQWTILPGGMMMSRYKRETPVSPKEEGGKSFNGDLMSRPPDSPLAEVAGAFDSRHHVFELRRGGMRIAMKLYRPEDRVFGPSYARREAMNLTFARKGILAPYVRPLRDDVSVRYDQKRGLWVPTYKWARLFTEMPEGYLSINRLDFEKMGFEERKKLMEEVGFAMGYLHRRRGFHGDPTLANILIRHPEWMKNRFSQDNIKYIDGESFGYVGEMPNRETIKNTFVDDLNTVREDALRLGLVRPEEDKEVFQKHMWNAYMSHWRAGARPSRLEKTIEELGPQTFFAPLPKASDFRPIVPTDEIIRASLRRGLYEQTGLRDYEAQQSREARSRLSEDTAKLSKLVDKHRFGLPPEP